MPMATKEETKNAVPHCAKTEILKVSVTNGGCYLYMKRLIDFVVALLAGLVLLIPMAVVALLIRLDSPGPVLFLQQRMGKDGKPFTIYKFRTMATSAPGDVATRTIENPEQYITKLGDFLRRSSIDELPQLWNVIKGDMSIIGYRPICLKETELNDLRMRCGVFAIRPGITGLAQVSGRDNLDIEEKVRLDAQYVAQCSFKMDIKCLLLTVKTVISGEGAV